MAETETLVAKVVIQGSIEAVWKEITKTDEIQRAVFNARLHGDLSPGGKIAIRTPDGKYTSVVGEVLEFDPPHRFSHTFRFTNHDDPPCTVTYELQETSGGVELTLTSSGVVKGSKTHKSMEQGGKLIVDNVKAVVEKGDVSFGVRMMYGMFKLTAFLAPKRCRSENWKDFG